MKRKLFALFLFFIIAAILLSAITAYAVANKGKAKQTTTSGLYIVAQELSEEPQTYLFLENADVYVSQAISNPGEHVYVGNWDNTQIDDMMQANQTRNIKLNSSYYTILLLSQDPPRVISVEFIQLLTIGWVLWGIAAITVVIIYFSRRHVNKFSRGLF
jgi:hypothetical protein